MINPTARKLTPNRHGSLRRFSGGIQSHVRLVCFPWAGGGASVFRRVAIHLPEIIELLAVQLPGREDRFGESPLLRMDLIVKHVLDDIISVADRPVVFFGHSMGALVAYEVARAFKAQFGREPQMLIVSGSGSPGSEEAYERCAGTAGEQEFIADMRKLGGTPREILEDAQMMRTFLPVMRADYEVLDTYVHRAAGMLSCPLIACAGTEDPSVSQESMDAWCQHTTGSCRQHRFGGDHFYLLSQQTALAQCLQEWVQLEEFAL